MSSQQLNSRLCRMYVVAPEEPRPRRIYFNEKQEMQNFILQRKRGWWLWRLWCAAQHLSFMRKGFYFGMLRVVGGKKQCFLAVSVLIELLLCLLLFSEDLLHHFHWMIYTERVGLRDDAFSTWFVAFYHHLFCWGPKFELLASGDILFQWLK